MNFHSVNPRAKFAACEADGFKSRLGDKWTMSVMMVLQSSNGKGLRFSEIKRSIDGISQKMLTATLRALERDGLVVRNAFAEVPPRVEYKLTDFGITLLPVINEFIGWVQDNWSTIRLSRIKFDNIQLDPEDTAV